MFSGSLSSFPSSSPPSFISLSGFINPWPRDLKNEEIKFKKHEFLLSATRGWVQEGLGI